MSEGLLRRMERRYLVVGDLVLRTALHLGGGDAAQGATNSPVLRRADGQPFIPGSSLKGAFRSTVEKLAATLELPNMDRDVLDTGSAWVKEFNARINQLRERKDWHESRIVAEVAREWPVTARLFGTPHTASKIAFADAYLCENQETVVQRRDGVAIDRDSERAMDGLLYDYEVVPPSLRFGFELTLDNPDDTELALACLGLAELLGGFFSIGGKRSSGLGRCILEPEQTQLYVLDLTDSATRFVRLRRYLTGANLAEKFELVADPVAFVNQKIDWLLKEVS